MEEPALITTALREIRRLRQRVAELEPAADDPVAVIGLACRFPGGASGPEAFWGTLADGVDAVGHITDDRWNISQLYDPDPDAPGKLYTRAAGLIDDIDKFDAPFFRISAGEADHMDPQQRHFLEVCWEALEDGGYGAPDHRPSAVGVFAGVMNVEYGQLARDINAFLGTGISASVLAGRVS